MSPTSAARPYASPRRAAQAAQTRADIITAATELFAERGWVATTIAAVAAQAGVAVDTVYASFGSKAGLLAAAKDVAKVGDTEPIALMERPGFDALDRGSRQDRLDVSARLIAETNERTRGIDAVWREAAASDPKLATMLSTREQGRRQDLADGLARLLSRPVDDDTLDSVWVLTSPEVWAKLHSDRGWTVQHYQRWLANQLDRLLPGP